jgi:tetratricopeptide (TPR) repeat protein
MSTFRHKLSRSFTLDRAFALLVVVALSVPAFSSSMAFALQGPDPILDMVEEDTVTFSPQEAITQCKKILETTDERARDTIVNALVRRGDSYLSLENPRAALQDYDRCLSLANGNIAIRWRKARALVALKQFDDARKELAAILSEAPNFAPAYHTQAKMLMAQGKLSEALACADIGHGKDSNYIEGYYTRGQIHYLMHDYKRALEDLDQVILRQPGLGGSRVDGPFRLRSAVLLALGRPREALSNCLVACRLDGSSFENRLQLWHCYSRCGKLNISLKLANDLVQTKPDDTMAQLCLAESRFKLGYLDDAGVAVKKALSLPEPDSLWARSHMATTLLHMGRYADALRIYEGVLKGAPDSFSALTGAATILASCPEEKIRNGSRARELAIKACKMTGYDQLDSLITLAMAEAECGNFPEALRISEKALASKYIDANLREDYVTCVRCFRAGKPFRNPSLPNAATK